MEDKTLKCKDCGANFIFTAGEQLFYKEKGFANEPKCCKNCSDAEKTPRRRERDVVSVTCERCGGEAKLPFKPRDERPVYCSQCFCDIQPAR